MSKKTTVTSARVKRTEMPSRIGYGQNIAVHFFDSQCTGNNYGLFHNRIVNLLEPASRQCYVGYQISCFNTRLFNFVNTIRFEFFSTR